MSDALAAAEEIELLPCPFCGGRAVFGQVLDNDHPDFGGHFIVCMAPGCEASTCLRFACGDDPKPLLAEAWNRRAATKRPQIDIPAFSRGVAYEICRALGHPFSGDGDAAIIARCLETALVRAFTKGGIPEPVRKQIEHILDEHSAWIARPNAEVTDKIALACTIAAHHIVEQAAIEEARA